VIARTGDITYLTYPTYLMIGYQWAAGPRSFFADVPPLRGEKAHWQCDEWAAMPKFEELQKPLGRPRECMHVRMPRIHYSHAQGARAA
jgi:hypothetical protein